MLDDRVVAVENSLIDSLYSQTAYYAQYFNQLLNSVKMLEQQIVTPSLLSYTELSRRVEITSEVFGFSSAIVVEKY